MDENNISYKVNSFMEPEIWSVIYRKGYLWVKLWGMIKGFAKRFFSLFNLRHYDYIFIHREAAPIGPPIMEWLIAKVFHKNIIFDFDDAIWVPNYSDSNKFFSFLKRYSDVSKVCSWAYKVSCGNNYLCNYALEYNNSVIYNPTTIDTINYHNRVKDYTSWSNNSFVMGWTGSHSTIRYLKAIIPVLEELEKEHAFEFHVISDINPGYKLKSFVYKKWNKENEIDDLLSFHVGLMPLSDDTWANGKCGFKALQYLALGIPALVSPIGVNSQIVKDGVNGFICRTPDEWKDKLNNLLLHREKLIELSRNSRKKIEDSFSVVSNTENFLNLFKP